MRAPVELHAQRVPHVRRHRCIDVLDRDPAAVLGVVERDVVLERVGARDVVVVAVLPAPDDTARLVLAAAHRLELHFDESVGERDVLFARTTENRRCPIAAARCGALGALASRLDGPRGAPRPVTPAIHPAGSVPGRSASKPTTSHCAMPASAAIASPSLPCPCFAPSLVCIAGSGWDGEAPRIDSRTWPRRCARRRLRRA